MAPLRQRVVVAQAVDVDALDPRAPTFPSFSTVIVVIAHVAHPPAPACSPPDPPSGVPVGYTAAAPAASRRRDVALRDRAADHEHDVVGAGGAQRVGRLLRERDVRAAEDAEPDDLHVLLHRDRRDRLRALADPGVDHLEPGVAAACGRRASRRGRGRRARAWRRARGRPCQTTPLEDRRLLELAPLVLEHVDHLPDRAVRLRAVDERRHEVVVVARRRGAAARRASPATSASERDRFTSASRSSWRSRPFSSIS